MNNFYSRLRVGDNTDLLHLKICLASKDFCRDVPLYLLAVNNSSKFISTVLGADLSLSAPSLRPKPGEQVSVKCTVSAGEAFRGWFRQQSGGGFSQVPQSSSASVQVEANSPVYTLRFTDVEVSQGGKYECRGSLNNKESFTLEVACKCYCIQMMLFV